MRSALPIALAAAILLALSLPAEADSVERNFAGSAQLDYHFVPTQRDANASAIAIDGFTLEATAKVAVDISDHLSASLKLCYGCHGFEADMAYFDLRVVDELNFRIGRFSPSFGSFNIRHDVANQRLSDKPLPYDMGRMLRRNAWKNGVLPSPFPDNGLEIDGTHWFGDSAQLDYAVYAVAGFRGTGTDLDFASSHSIYYVDNNGRPSVGGRLALTLKMDATHDMTVGASGMGGTYDPSNEYVYEILGGDLSFRFGRTNVRFEYLVRHQTIPDSPTLLYETGHAFAKHGAYAEVEQPLSSVVDLIGRVDGMMRYGNVDASTGLRDGSSVLRYTIGSAFAVERGLRIKVSSELWQFNDPDASGHKVDASLHTAAVGTF
jgi:hypothetical protein